MRSVEQCHFPLVIWSFGRHEHDIQPGLVCRKLLGNLLRGFDYPKVEDFSFVKKLVLLTYAGCQLFDSVPRVARSDSVHKGGIYVATVLKPV